MLFQSYFKAISKLFVYCMIRFGNVEALLFRLNYNQINGQKTYAHCNLIRSKISAQSIKALVRKSTSFLEPQTMLNSEDLLDDINTLQDYESHVKINQVDLDLLFN
ncbi:hypothetical protein BpHYR1_036193 [Brachionus plicatilis]|uniref:Uncharacterized protein n=1 Tax=Brachionus plicatilis TaxID=10195 RepID=A0A3M7RJU4_BRAPC|nr:hypothetical protein BpHYR1_036193 [Brachionus plicatilis]